MSAKTENQKGWLFVLPALVLVALNAVIPLMAVVNYSVQETFGNNLFFFEGVKWFEEVLRSERFHAALVRQLIFSGIILAIEVPLGVAIALAMPRRGPWVSVCLVLDGAAAAHPLERRRRDVEHLRVAGCRHARQVPQLPRASTTTTRSSPSRPGRR